MKAKKNALKRQSFRGMFLKRLACLVIVVIVITTLFSFYYYNQIIDYATQILNSEYSDSVLDWIESEYLYSEGGSNYLELSGESSEDQWIEALGYRTSVFSSLSNSYWCIYDQSNDAIIKEASNELYVGIYFNLGTEENPNTELRFFSVNPYQYDEVLSIHGNFSGIRRAPYVLSGYLDGTTIYIEKYADENGWTSEMEIPEEINTSSMLYFDCTGDTFTFYSWTPSKNRIMDHCGTCSGIEICTCGTWPYINSVSEELKNEAAEYLNDLLDTSLDECSENVKLSFSTRRIWNVSSADVNGKTIYFLYTFEYDLINDILPALKEIIIGSVIGLLAAVIISLLLAERAYRKYKVNRELLDYRRTLTNTMAHDLKSPLMVISGYAENMSEGKSPEKNEFYTAEILKTVKNMNNIIESILELSKNEEAVVTDWEKIDLKLQTLELAKNFDAAMKEKNIVLNVEGDGQISGNRTMISTMIRNLLDNAVKYSPAGGRIDINIAAGSYTVSNQTREEVDKPVGDLFKPFVKGGSARTGQTGSGLGLAIVKNICDAHGIWADIKMDGEMFSVLLKF